VQPGEDCLYLNVYTAAKSNEKRPVMVWIHGGALTSGSGSIYNGEALAKKGVVVVTVNYRLGVFGYFAHPELTKESDHNGSGNYGLQDQVAALQWVQKNIAAFGGDPEERHDFRRVRRIVEREHARRHSVGKGSVPSGDRSERERSSRAFASLTPRAMGAKFAQSAGAESLAALRRNRPMRCRKPVGTRVRTSTTGRCPKMSTQFSPRANRTTCQR
jgi:para-nitrobenzyl esterase